MSRETASRVRLFCEHVQTFDPRPFIGDTVYCRKCRDWRLVMVIAIDWHVKCVTSRCKMGHYWGEDKSGAMRCAVRHLTRFPSHTVKVQYGDEDPVVLGSAQIPLIIVTEL